MAESVVNILLQKLVDLTQQEWELLKGVHDEIAYIRNQFSKMQASLRDADSKAAINNEVKEWVKQVRDAAYEIEDVLDEYILSRLPMDGNSKHSITRRLKAGISHPFKCVKAKHKIGIQIQGLKKKIEELYKQREGFAFNEEGSSSSERKFITKRDPREDALLLEESDLVGLNGPRTKLVDYLLEAEKRLGVVAVLGEGGLGKTTLVKKVYDSSNVKDQFTHRAWITVSQTFDATSVLRSLIKQFFPGRDEVEKMEVIDLKQVVKNELQGKRYIVVLDDIWKLDAWKELKLVFPNDGESGSRIMVTTRSQNMAHICIEDYGHVYPHQHLDSDDSWKLFYRKAFSSQVKNMTSEKVLRDRSVKFLKKCNGLPLAIVTIGGLLSIKQPNEWDRVYQCLGSLMDGSKGAFEDIDDHLKDLRIVISLSYNDLPYHLKPCFLYLSNFPEDYSIRCSRLLRLWVAAGFVERRPNRDVTMEEIANDYLNELIQRSLVQVDKMDERMRIKSCKIHDHIRDFIIGKARDQNFVEVIAKEQEEEFQSSTSVSRRPPRHLSISGIQNQLPENKKSGSGIRSLFFFDSRIIPFSNFKLLRVLDLEHSNLGVFPSAIVNLLYLRYLSLRRNNIKEVPSLIGNLVYLETLNLKSTYVKQLPVEILKLTQLRNLSGSYPWIIVPDGIHVLTTLENLKAINADVEGSSIMIKGLQKLTQLRKLSIRWVREEDEMQLFASLGKMKYLLSLKLTSRSRKFQHSSHLSSLPSSLQKLHIQGGFDELPGWIDLLENLEILKLDYSRLTNDQMDRLGRLPNLVCLAFGYAAFDGEELNFAQGRFPRLKKLVLKTLENLIKIKVEEGAMPCIQSIRFVGCNNLEVPIGLEHLFTLHRIVHDHMPQHFIIGLEQYCWKTGFHPVIEERFDYPY
ncbi:hypothetical protein AQUCO_02000281v1 [Aquilegia coerulea]|uniref:AAA+ ATPase domain-containing protein n=1 Tax=Aquilegia coerulea TaxID=218851 RepID=A0A2G5DGU0_AQUCA|nr:hypothetical protein AQUCO_02000281v1 [Aquilegia coerulea]